MSEIKLIPAELYKIIPVFDGNKNHLNLFLRKCEYIVDRFKSNTDQEEYLLHAITSRLTGNAATLISEREDIKTWAAFKELFKLHFGDPRSEECLAIELETLKIKQSESYTDFYERIQSVKSTLISKVNQTTDFTLRTSKVIIYNNTALKVFLYNLSENMVRIVRLKAPKTLEHALSIVLEEVNFHDQYQMRNKMLNASHSLKPQLSSALTPQQPFKFGIPPQPTAFKPMMPFNNQFRSNPYVMPKFNFGIPPNRQINTPRPNPPLQFGNYKPNYNPAQFGYRPNFGYRPPGYQPMPPMLPHQFGNPNRSNVQPNTQNKRTPNDLADTDVTMRTAPQKPQQGFRLNELEIYPPNYEYYHPYSTNDENFEDQYSYFPYDNNDYTTDLTYDNPTCQPEEIEDIEQNNITDSTSQAENFHMPASKDLKNG